jgi:hypothetical protein
MARDLETFGAIPSEARDAYDMAAGPLDQLSDAFLGEMKHYLESSPAIRATIGSLTIQKIQSVYGNVHHFYILEQGSCPCKYAGRVHKSNRQFFEYSHPENCVHYKCYDDECIEVWRKGGWVFPFGDIADLIHGWSGLDIALPGIIHQME